jgi:hypothetical protein
MGQPGASEGRPRRPACLDAHARRRDVGQDNVVVHGLRGRSGRFDRLVPIGEFRNGAHRVDRPLLREWGGLTVEDGFVQRSAHRPAFCQPARFRRWLRRRRITFRRSNWERTPLVKRFVYKLVTDNGGAPCVHGGILSLAICKPKIRTTAATGDWIFGFGGKRLGGRLIYIARVTEVVAGHVYYRDARYRRRPDCIDRWTGRRFVQRDGARSMLGVTTDQETWAGGRSTRTPPCC